MSIKYICNEVGSFVLERVGCNYGGRCPLKYDASEPSRKYCTQNGLFSIGDNDINSLEIISQNEDIFRVAPLTEESLT